MLWIYHFSMWCADKLYDVLATFFTMLFTPAFIIIASYCAAFYVIANKIESHDMQTVAYMVVVFSGFILYLLQCIRTEIQLNRMYIQNKTDMLNSHIEWVNRNVMHVYDAIKKGE